MFEIIEKMRAQIPQLNYPDSSFILEPCDGPGIYKVIGTRPGGEFPAEPIQTGVISCSDVEIMIETAKQLMGAEEAM